MYITDEQKASTKPEDLKTCLEAGVVPDAYKDILTDVKVVEDKTYVADIADSDVLKMTDAEMKAKAAEGYFVRAAPRLLKDTLSGLLNAISYIALRDRCCVRNLSSATA